MSMHITVITKKAEELGYTLIIDEGTIDYIFPTDRNSYTPELFKPRKDFDGMKPWTIQTTAYGAGTSEDITKVIDGYKRAQKMVIHLENCGIPVA